MTDTPKHDKPIPEPAASRSHSGMREEALPYQLAPFSDLPEEEEQELYADLDDPIFHPTVEQIRRDLLEAREDIKAGRVCSVDEVLAAIDEAFEEGAKRRQRQNGHSVD